MIFQSTQPKRAATPEAEFDMAEIAISIHAAQEGCDSDWPCYTLPFYRISIHAAQEGCDAVPLPINSNLRIFQSTQPKRAATA